MISKERGVVYLDSSVVNSVFKILPLYEEEDEGLDIYLDTLLRELYGFDKVIDVNHVEYVSLLATLEGLRQEICKKDNKPIVKREVFKSIGVVKQLLDKLSQG